MTLLSAEGKNFRSYKDVKVEFSPGINIVIGENDDGKTNLLRLLNLVTTNRPKGDDYISWDGGDMSAKVTVSEGITVERFRNVVWDKKEERWCAGTTNQYKIESEKEPFNAVGFSVPEPIQKILNIDPTNIHFQLEGPFLLEDSPPDVARHYNKAVNLEIIDRSISNIAKTLREENSELKKVKSDQKDLRKKLKSFSWVAKAEKELTRLEQLQAKRSRLEKECVELFSLFQELRKFSQEKDKFNEIVQYEKEVKRLIALDAEIEKETSEYNELSDLFEKLESYREQSEELSRIILHEKAVNRLIENAADLQKMRIEYDELFNLNEQLIDLRQKESDYKQILKFESQVNELITLDTKIEKETDEYNQLYDLVESLGELQAKLELGAENLSELEEEFKIALPDLCPIFEVECEHINKRKKANVISKNKR